MAKYNEYDEVWAEPKHLRRGHRRKQTVQNKDGMTFGDDEDDLFEMQINPDAENKESQQIGVKVYEPETQVKKNGQRGTKPPQKKRLQD